MELSSHRLHLIVGKSGYVGVCPTDAGWTDFAAAIDPIALRSHASIGECVQILLRECGIRSSSMLADAKWLSTPHLTRISHTVAQQNVYLVGDAMGYVEPFTGEGMSWALAGAQELVSILGTKTCNESTNCMDVERQWEAWAGRQRRWKQLVSRWVANQVRHPKMAMWALRACDWIPALRRMILKKAMQ
ncbi:MAG: hypothetical protein ABL921_11840 [Pirellula sp.]